MAYRRITEAVATPVTRNDVKAHLRVTEPDEDRLLDVYIKAATRSVENYISQSLITQTYKATFDYFPALNKGYSRVRRKNQDRFGSVHSYDRLTDGNTMLLHWGPVQSVESIEYFDGTNSLTQLPANQYYLSSETLPARISLDERFYYPETYDRPDAVQINYTTGFGDTPASVPDDIKQAVLIMTAQLYEFREPTLAGNGLTVTSVPMTAQYLLNPYRVPYFG